MLVRVDRVELASSSTVGYGEGENIETTERVRFVGDHRPMMELAFAVSDAGFEVLDLPIVELESWQIIQKEDAA